MSSFPNKRYCDFGKVLVMRASSSLDANAILSLTDSSQIRKINPDLLRTTKHKKTLFLTMAYAFVLLDEVFFESDVTVHQLSDDAKSTMLTLQDQEHDVLACVNVTSSSFCDLFASVRLLLHIKKVDGMLHDAADLHYKVLRMSKDLPAYSEQLNRQCMWLQQLNDEYGSAILEDQLAVIKKVLIPHAW